MIDWKALSFAVLGALLIIAAIVGLVLFCVWLGPVGLLAILALMVFGILVWAIYDSIAGY